MNVINLMQLILARIFFLYFVFDKERIFVVINVWDMMQLKQAWVLLDIFALRKK